MAFESTFRYNAFRSSGCGIDRKFSRDEQDKEQIKCIHLRSMIDTLQAVAKLFRVGHLLAMTQPMRCTYGSDSELMKMVMYWDALILNLKFSWSKPPRKYRRKAQDCSPAIRDSTLLRWYWISLTVFWIHKTRFEFQTCLVMRRTHDARVLTYRLIWPANPICLLSELERLIESRLWSNSAHFAVGSTGPTKRLEAELKFVL